MGVVGTFVLVGMKVAFFLAFLLALVAAQEVDLIIIDDFTVGANEHLIVVTLDSDLSRNDPPVTDQDSFSQPGCSGLIGCSRDMEMRVLTGFNGRSFSSEIFSIANGFFDAEWSVSNPKTSSSIATLQYDGQDGSFALDTSGLGGIDLTVGGTARSYVISAVTDIRIQYTTEVYDRSGGVCELEITIPATPGEYDYDETFFEFGFDDFDGDCDFTDVGAIELFLPSNDAVDAIVRIVKITGVVPNPSGSSSPVPSVIPPPPPETCMCHCPIFTCQLIFDPDDDDENNAYYFDDDDEREVIGSNGTINYYDFETASSGVMIKVSTLLLAVVAALVL